MIGQHGDIGLSESSSTSVSVMKASHLWNGNNLAALAPFDLAWRRSVTIQRQVRA